MDQRWGYFWLITSAMMLLSSPQMEVFDRGLIFVKQPDLRLTSSFWTVVIDCNFEPLISEILQLTSGITFATKSLNQDQSQAVRPQISEKFGQNGFHVIDETLAVQLCLLRNTSQAVYHRLMKIRRATTLRTPSSQGPPINKRAAFDFVGQTMRFLFGTLNSDDLQLLNQRISTLESQTQEILHLSEEFATIVNSTIENQLRSREALKQIAILTRTLVYTQNRTIAVIQTTALIHLLSQALNEIQGRVVDLEISLESAAKNRLSPLLVSPQKLAALLNRIMPLLPAELTFFDSPSKNEFYTKYANIHVTAAALPNSLRLFLQIPLVNRKNYFTLYRILSLPAKVPDVNVSYYIKSDYRFIGVAKDFQTYFLLDEQSHHCTGDSNQVCQLQNLIYKMNSPSCEFYLISGNTKEAKKYCEMHLIPYNYRVFKQIHFPGRWAYSVSEPTDFIIDCSSQLRKTTNSSVIKKVLIGSGILAIPFGCIGQSLDVKLPLVFPGKGSFSTHEILDSEIIVRPRVGALIANLTLQRMKTYSDVLDQKLDLIMRLPGVTTEFKKSSFTVKDWERHISEIEALKSSLPPRFTGMSILYNWGPIILIAVALIAIGILYKLCCGRSEGNFSLPERVLTPQSPSFPPSVSYIHRPEEISTMPEVVLNPVLSEDNNPETPSVVLRKSIRMLNLQQPESSHASIP